MSSTRAATSHAASSAATPHASSGGSTPSWMNNPYRAYQAWQRMEYPNQMWYLVASGIALLAISHVVYLLHVRSRKNALMKGLQSNKNNSDPEKNVSSNVQVSSWRRKSSAMEALWKIVVFRWTIPYGRNYVLSFTELFFTLGYLAACLIWLLVHSHGGVETFWANRAGALALKQIPLLSLLAGKNNLIGLISGIGYEKINIMHRSVARSLFVLVLLHGFSKVDSMTPASLAMKKYTTGVLAATAFGAIFLTSIRPVRTHAFEFFLILHICLVSCSLAGVYFHQPEDAKYVWVFISFWLFDRIVRGIHLTIINRGKKESHEAIVEVLARDSVRLVLPNRHISWKAGQHVFLILPGVSNIPFEAHPFTIANIPDYDEHGRNVPTDLIFYIRAMDGFTRKLHDYAVLHHGKPVTALVDGPYGCPPPVNTFSTVILIAGGSGASFTVPLLLDILHAVRHGRSPVKKVVFVWSVKDNADLKWASEVLNDACAHVPSTLTLDIRLHVTRANGFVPALGVDGEPQSPLASPISPTEKFSPLSPGEKTDSLSTSVKGSRADMTATVEEVSTHEGHLTPRREHLKIHLGRPDIPVIIQEEISASVGPVSVNACGPSCLTKAVRASLCTGGAGPSAILHGGAPVSMHVENFGATRAAQ